MFSVLKNNLHIQSELNISRINRVLLLIFGNGTIKTTEGIIFRIQPRFRPPTNFQVQSKFD